MTPGVIVMSLCVFKLVHDQAQALPSWLQRSASWLAPTTLGIYVIHPLVLTGLGEIGFTPFFVHPILGIPLMTSAAFLLSGLFIYLMQRLPVARCLV
jgi:surface polysaccharide O-acyltransferase-like enzyme